MQLNEPIYSERQRFHPQDGILLAVLWLVILTSPTFFLWAIVQQIVMDSPVGNNPANDFVLIVLALIFGIGLPLFMYTMGLDTQVRESGIFVRFWPFHRKWVVFGFDSIQKAEASIYSPLKDYGGWGIRYGRKGKAYNVSGNKGVLLTLKDGKNVLIGSKNHEVLCSAITEILP
jgi:hypothetical protein